MSLRTDLATMNGITVRVSVEGEREIENHRVSWGRAQTAGGMSCGSARYVCRVGDGPWQDVDFESSLKLRRTFDACDTLTELDAFVINGSQWQPFTIGAK